MSVALGAVSLSLQDLHTQTATDANCRNWMRQSGLLATNVICRKCGAQMEEREYDRVVDKVTWRCLLRQCRTITSIRHGSFFECSHLTLKSLIDLQHSDIAMQTHICLKCSTFPYMILHQLESVKTDVPIKANCMCSCGCHTEHSHLSNSHICNLPDIAACID